MCCAHNLIAIKRPEQLMDIGSTKVVGVDGTVIGA